MENFLEFIKTDNFVMTSAILNLILLILVIVLMFFVINMNKKYIKFGNLWMCFLNFFIEDN